MGGKRDISPVTLLALLPFLSLWNSSVSLPGTPTLLKVYVENMDLTVSHRLTEVPDIKKCFKITLQVMCLDNYEF